MTYPVEKPIWSYGLPSCGQTVPHRRYRYLSALSWYRQDMTICTALCKWKQNFQTCPRFNSSTLISNSLLTQRKTVDQTTLDYHGTIIHLSGKCIPVTSTKSYNVPCLGETRKNIQDMTICTALCKWKQFFQICFRFCSLPSIFSSLLTQLNTVDQNTLRYHGTSVHLSGEFIPVTSTQRYNVPFLGETRKNEQRQREGKHLIKNVRGSGFF